MSVHEVTEGIAHTATDGGVQSTQSTTALAKRANGEQPQRDKLGKWLPGKLGGPGRKAGLSGRAAALARLDMVAGKAKNLDALEVDLQREFDKGPAAFWRLYLAPLLPKTAILDAGGVGPLIKVIVGVNVEHV